MFSRELQKLNPNTADITHKKVIVNGKSFEPFFHSSAEHLVQFYAAH